ncbi:alginate lyase family protein [Rhabdobacter roseus]|uniref:Alginate lyase domain-containing protein n=1 Tax=Rhabdobacter roseus TaxID=1655419 RepID=A0A840TQ59_9BACT|nr:alginate lyase family protein [Rhabdobacter roseus]MBB5285951.1 hypothetical protein [Rhabdobacter roseus]
MIPNPLIQRKSTFWAMLCWLLSSFALTAGLPKSTPPVTFLVKPSVLQDNKAKLKKKDPALKRAVAALSQQADQALQRGPYTVTAKGKVPPSGDKRDYMSVGPYWWPDSSKADGLPYIRKDGQVNPERFAIQDAEYYKALCQDVQLLGVAWYYTEDKKYAEHAARLLRVWFLDETTRMNPHLNYGQAVPGRTEGRGIGLIDTHGVTKLIDGIQLLKDSPALSAADYRALQDWYRQFLDWMLTSPVGLDEADEHNNHGTYYDVQAASIALFTEQPQLAKKILEEQTKARIESQLKEDGSQPHELARTLSWGYSVMNLRGFFELALLGENVGVDLWHYQTPQGKSLQKAFDWMLSRAAGEKAWEHQQIKPMDKQIFVPLARTGKVLYPQSPTKSFLDQYPDEPQAIAQLTHALF